MSLDSQLRLAYLVSEWPGQTHIWIWREICHLRELGVDVYIYSTRPPDARERSRHTFTESAAKETRYLWPRRRGAIAWDILRTFVRCPLAVIGEMIHIARLPLTKRRGFRTALPVTLMAAEMAEMARRDGIQHVHVASAARSALIAMALKRIAGVPYSLTVNANLEWWGGAMKEKFENASLIVPIAKWLYQDILNKNPSLPAGRLILAPVGVNVHQWKAVARTAPSAGQPWRICSVGRLHPSKGFETLIRSVAQLTELGYQLRLTIIGEGRDRQRLQTLIDQLGLQESVTMVGSQAEHDIRSLLERSEIFALASHSEPLGVVFMEAMSTGIPTIGTDAGGVPEIIEDGVTGYLVASQDARCLAECIMKIIARPEDAFRIGREGRKTIEEKFHSELGARRLRDAIVSLRADSLNAGASLHENNG